MKRKTEKEMNKELMEYIMRHRLPPQEARALLRAVKQIIAIQKHEHLEVTMIKSRLLPFERW